MKGETRDRLLRATAELLEESGDPPSTRAICGRAGVTAPTLYHHFGNKQALIEAVIGYGLTQYPTGPAGDDDPIAAVRAGWDAHVRYGLANPTFYVLVHGRIRAGVPCAVVVPAQPALESLFAAVARRGLLRVPVPDAAARVLAANIGVTLSLIGQPEDARDPLLSGAVREAVLTSIVAGETADAARHVPAPGETIDAAGRIPTAGETSRVPTAGGGTDEAGRVRTAGGGADEAGRVPTAGGGTDEASRVRTAGGRADEASPVPAAGRRADMTSRVPAVAEKPDGARVAAEQTAAERALAERTAAKGTTERRTDTASRAQAAVTLRAALADDPSGLTPGETALLSELLDRLGRER